MIDALYTLSHIYFFLSIRQTRHRDNKFIIYSQFIFLVSKEGNITEGFQLIFTNGTTCKNNDDTKTTTKASFQARCSEKSFFINNSTFDETMLKIFDGVCETFIFIEGKEFCKHTDIERINRGVTSKIDGGFIASLIFVSMYHHFLKLIISATYLSSQ